MRRILALLLLVPLAAAPASGTFLDNDALQRARAADQRAVFGEALDAAGLACTGVSAAVFAGKDGAGNAYWDMRCVDGGMYRATLSPTPAMMPDFLSCGAAAPAPRSGPCFQPVTAAAGVAAAVTVAPAPLDLLAGASLPAAVQRVGLLVRPAAAPPRTGASGGTVPTASTIVGFTGVRQAACRALCADRPQDGISACIGICAQDGDPNETDTVHPGMRFTAIYATSPPFGGVGIASGSDDRLAVHVAAATACEAHAGDEPCHFQVEAVNRCGAVAQATERSPHAMAVTADIRTFVASILVTAEGSSVAEAERGALAACEARQNTPGRREAGGGGPVCRVTASSC